MVDYYDTVLGLIPLSFLGIGGTLYGIGASLSLAISAGALVAAGLIGHAMFVRTPAGGSASTDGSTAQGPSAQGSDGQYSTAD